MIARQFGVDHTSRHAETVVLRLGFVEQRFVVQVFDEVFDALPDFDRDTANSRCPSRSMN